MSKYDLSDNQWNAVKDEIPAKTSRSGQPRRDPRELINAIVWVARTGAPWCELDITLNPAFLKHEATIPLPEKYISDSIYI